MVHPDVEQLVKLVARLFYNDDVGIILDQLGKVNKIRDEALADLMHMPRPQISALLRKLKSENLIKTEDLKEVHGQRIIERIDYFIDYRLFVDSVKYRLIKIQEQIQKDGTVSNESDSHKFICPNCGSKYTEFEAMDYISDDGNFICRECSVSLEEIEANSDWGSNTIADQLVLSASSPSSPTSSISTTMGLRASIKKESSSSSSPSSTPTNASRMSDLLKKFNQISEPIINLLKSIDILAKDHEKMLHDAIQQVEEEEKGYGDKTGGKQKRRRKGDVEKEEEEEEISDARRELEKVKNKDPFLSSFYKPSLSHDNDLSPEDVSYYSANEKNRQKNQEMNVKEKLLKIREHQRFGNVNRTNSNRDIKGENIWMNTWKDDDEKKASLNMDQESRGLFLQEDKKDFFGSSSLFSSSSSSSSPSSSYSPSPSSSSYFSSSSTSLFPSSSSTPSSSFSSSLNSRNNSNRKGN